MTRRTPAAPGFLGRLGSSRSGNTLAMMAIALFPLCALAGSAIDTARLYVVKVRLQQACDAGALAGRKFMADSNDATLDGNATTQATTFFNNNFRTGWLGNRAVSFTPVKTTDKQVAGTARATVPMTIMKMFGAPDVALTVTCEARFDVADADIMFVLDTTGSMSCAASDTSSSCIQSGTYTREDGTLGYYDVEVSNAKIKALRQAVLDFYDTMVSNADPTTHIRYGFVPYTATANVGKILRDSFPSYLISNTWKYQSRSVLGDSNSGSPQSSTTTNNVAQSACPVSATRNPTAGYNSQGYAYVSGQSWTQNGSSGTGKCTVYSNQKVIPLWRYQQVPFNVSAYVAGNQIVDPSKVTGETSESWRGCIEERNTTATASFNIGALPPDLDPDLVPTSDDTRWRPAWPDVIYYRGGSGTSDSTSDYPNVGGDPAYLAGGIAPCPKQALRLGSMTRSQVENYLSASGDFRAHGGTYHDSGMIWGTRMISPSGIFAADTAPWPGRNAPNRHIIFMTDGDMAPTLDTYGIYGEEREDLRVTGGATSEQLARHNARFVAECQAARARNITVWVIAFGSALNDQLKACATQDNNHIFYASNDTALKNAFTTIAKQVAMLRVSK